MEDYKRFVASKRREHQAVGWEVDSVHPSLFPHQADCVRWACRLGRAAIFADTGLGKTRMELDWARLVAERTSRRVLLLAPLAVSEQTIAEAVTMGIDAGRIGDDAVIHVTNYERLHRVDVTEYAGVVLDESSILKSQTGSTRTALIEAFSNTDYRLAATATPAPNDHTELGNHAEFLGVSTQQEMLAEYFLHDSSSSSARGWRLKGHARRDFWRWVSSWAVVVRKPSDLGHDDQRYNLPPLNLHNEVVKADGLDLGQGTLFVVPAQTLTEQRKVRRQTVDDRAARAAELASRPGQWIVWCELNDESQAVASMVDGAVEVSGSDEPEVKAERMLGFARGKYRVLVSKPSICGFGMNFQRCHQQVFVGLTHSYEQFYQAVRRSWRFGQTNPVDVYLVQTTADGAIAHSLKRKADAADEMAAEMVALVKDHQLASVRGRRAGVMTAASDSVIAPSFF
jgi:superfamily II DNA or RNA helicase